jgi:hypothetical protein
MLNHFIRREKLSFHGRFVGTTRLRLDYLASRVKRDDTRTERSYVSSPDPLLNPPHHASRTPSSARSCSSKTRAESTVLRFSHQITVRTSNRWRRVGKGQWRYISIQAAADRLAQVGGRQRAAAAHPSPQ